MKEVTNKEIREISEVIIKKTNDSDNNFDAIDDVSDILKDMFTDMNIAVEKIKRDADCECEDCGCED